MRKIRRGFSLVEVMIVLMLLGVFTVVSYRLLVANFRLTANVRDANDNSARMNDATRLLRADVTDATSIEMSTANVLRIHQPDQRLVEWQVEHDLMTRKSGSKENKWELSHPVNLKLDGAIVLVSTGSAQPIAMASMHAIPAGGRP